MLVLNSNNLPTYRPTREELPGACGFLSYIKESPSIASKSPPQENFFPKSPHDFDPQEVFSRSRGTRIASASEMHLPGARGFLDFAPPDPINGKASPRPVAQSFLDFLGRRDISDSRKSRPKRSDPPPLFLDYQELPINHHSPIPLRTTRFKSTAELLLDTSEKDKRKEPKSEPNIPPIFKKVNTFSSLPIKTALARKNRQDDFDESFEVSPSIEPRQTKIGMFRKMSYSKSPKG
jgi:hypothetical protein